LFVERDAIIQAFRDLDSDEDEDEDAIAIAKYDVSKGALGEGKALAWWEKHHKDNVRLNVELKHSSGLPFDFAARASLSESEVNIEKDYAVDGGRRKYVVLEKPVVLKKPQSATMRIHVQVCSGLRCELHVLSSRSSRTTLRSSK